jgi:DNA polymerase III subunit epsilon
MRRALKCVNSCALRPVSRDAATIMREIVLDTETTGVNPTEGHRVLEIGAVEIVHQVLTGRVFHQLINPERDVPDEAVRIHGHTASALKGKPKFADVVDDFLSFVGESPLVIHNAEFDVRFVNAELARLGRKPIEMDRVVDTLSLARKKHPGLPNNLDALCDRYRIDRSRRERHGALLDAELLVEVYCELTGGRQRSLSFDEAPDSSPTIMIACSRPIEPRAPRRLLIEADEALAHLAHVKTLGEQAIWFRYGSAPT